MFVDAVLEVIKTSPVNVLFPAKDCAPMETRPVLAVPANGILNVCVWPEEAILNSLPLYPVAKYWKEVEMEFNVVMPVAAVGDQVKPEAELDDAVSTKLSVPTFNLINVFPAPTRISPFVYELYPVPP